MSIPFNFSLSACSVPVFLSHDWRVTSGANEGGSLGLVQDMVLDDVCQLSSTATPHALDLEYTKSGGYRVAHSSRLGTQGARIHCDGTIILMTFEGKLVETLVLVEIQTPMLVRQVYLFPLAPADPGTHHVLIGLDQGGGPAAYAKMASVLWTRRNDMCRT